jgi:hypothetical protein
MDADQLEQFMLAFQTQHQQFLERVLPLQAPSASMQQSSANPASINLALLQPFENFDPKRESFKYYRQQFENFLEMKKITSNRQWCAQMFLNSPGASNYNMLSALLSPRTPPELTYDELMNTFEVHLCPKKNILVSQHHFPSS